MFLLCDALWVQKKGNLKAEFEDAFWPRKRVQERRCQEISLAIADGATESSFSAIWANQLVRAYCRGNSQSVSSPDSLLAKQRAWLRFVNRKPLPWYAEEKVRSGAFSSILGITLTEDDEEGRLGSWHSIAIGDSCLAQLRDDEIVTAFPLTRALDFNNSPFLLSSSPDANKGLEANVVTAEGRWQSGDKFYLMTDALAAWFFREVEENRMPWHTFIDLDTESCPFHGWVEGLRTTDQIRNDDVTLYRIEIE